MTTIHDACRACSSGTIRVLDLGEQMVSDFPESSHWAAPKIPLSLIRCHPCGLIQLSHTVDRDLIYRDRYWYRSGVNEAMVQALGDVVQAALEVVPLSPGDAVVDIGANDGTLLSWYRRLGAGQYEVKRIAYEPAQNLASELSGHCELLIPDYFPSSLKGGYIKSGTIKILTSVAMFYDLEDPRAFCAEVKRVLHQDGVWVNQLAYLPRMLDNAAFDSVCHEHLTYWALAPMVQLLSAYGLKVIAAQEVPINEGSIRLFIAHRRAKIPTPQAGLTKIWELLDEEKTRKLRDANDAYLFLAGQANEIRRKVREVLLQAVLTSKTVDLYGASTKGNYFLQWCDIGPKHVRWAVERSSEKWGRHTVTGVPIVPELRWREHPGDWAIVLPWAFKESFLKRERAYLERGGTLIFPMPKPVAVTREGEKEL